MTAFMQLCVCLWMRVRVCVKCMCEKTKKKEGYESSRPKWGSRLFESHCMQQMTLLLGFTEKWHNKNHFHFMWLHVLLFHCFFLYKGNVCLVFLTVFPSVISRYFPYVPTDSLTPWSFVNKSSWIKVAVLIYILISLFIFLIWMCLTARQPLS